MQNKTRSQSKRHHRTVVAIFTILVTALLVLSVLIIPRAISTYAVSSTGPNPHYVPSNAFGDSDDLPASALKSAARGLASGSSSVSGTVVDASSGQPVANLVASTSGTDADWVVKLIDVYPDEVGGDAVMGGYQLMIAADIFRGRYREGFDAAKPIAADAPLLYRFGLPNANHVFLPGHRIMVQVQSSWFPLYDRNPQTFVPSIFWAKPGDYRKATHRVYHAPTRSSFVELPLDGPT